MRNDDFLETYAYYKMAQGLAPLIGVMMLFVFGSFAWLLFDMWAREHLTLWIVLSVVSWGGTLGVAAVAVQSVRTTGLLSAWGPVRLMTSAAVVASLFTAMAAHYWPLQSIQPELLKPAPQLAADATRSAAPPAKVIPPRFRPTAADKADFEPGLLLKVLANPKGQLAARESASMAWSGPGTFTLAAHHQAFPDIKGTVGYRLEGWFDVKTTGAVSLGMEVKADTGNSDCRMSELLDGIEILPKASSFVALPKDKPMRFMSPPEDLAPGLYPITVVVACSNYQMEAAGIGDHLQVSLLVGVPGASVPRVAAAGDLVRRRASGAEPAAAR